MQVAGAQTNIGRHGPAEQEFETQAGGADFWPDTRQLGQAEKVKALREHKIFLQDSVAIEHIARVGQKGFVGSETGKGNGLG
ncbi:hypothetical protein D3C86_1421380 [compost metagenome]